MFIMIQDKVSVLLLVLALSGLSACGHDERVEPVWRTLVLANDTNAILRLLQSDPTIVSEEDSFQYLPIHLAVAAGYPEMCRILVEHGSDVNARMRYGGWTPLHFAVPAESTEIINLLLKAGADPTIEDDDGTSAIALAADSGKPELVAMLKAKT
ncbi:MAG: hypothetical protein GC168_01880 [Candidatus Hydrogenedens sp.]|nr:hypothetical protein [Candidatus Hydrogenedens sp.]